VDIKTLERANSLVRDIANLDRFLVTIDGYGVITSCHKESNLVDVDQENVDQVNARYHFYRIIKIAIENKKHELEEELKNL